MKGPRAIQRERQMRRDPFGRLSLEINRYLNTVGWNAVVIGNPQVRGHAKEGIVNFEFAVRCTGGKLKLKAERSDDARRARPAPPRKRKGNLRDER